MIHALPALIIPDPIIDQPLPTQIIDWRPLEIYRHLLDCVRCLPRLPVEMLERVFGKNPTYKWEKF
jgi:hypothetical protein